MIFRPACLFSLFAACNAFPAYLRSESPLSAQDNGDANVDGLKRIPDAAHPFQPPGPTDQRGPCPGLNTLANHGYLPRSGIVTQADVIAATAEGFNMGPDLAELLWIISVAYDGDLITGKLSIGGPDPRTAALGSLEPLLGYEGGLDYHSTGPEGDTTATRQDQYFNESRALDPNLYIQMQSIAAKYGGQYTIDAMKDVQKARYDHSLAHNPIFYFLPVEALVMMGAKAFVPAFLSNGTFGAGGIANEASIAAIFGARKLPDGRYENVPERFPRNWFRRGTPFSLVDTLAAILDFYTSRDIPFGANAGRVDAFVPLDIGAITDVNGLACVLKQALQANVPSSIAQPGRDLEAVVSFIVDRIDPLFQDFGCPSYNATQREVYSAASQWNQYGPPASADQRPKYGQTSS
ncbi:heme-thiolate peroxidase [Hericium alpestre]|uniref:Heme-thiolate peroxidase n=1 Tax=Hericium alpestre TaxID=135208 RepID=A0A4Z0A4P4_9AGAM|nr:heme-thiolate peroxidase [Hericium alpestre]